MKKLLKKALSFTLTVMMVAVVAAPITFAEEGEV